MDSNTAHAFSKDHRQAIEDSASCACFYCLESFVPSEISEWTDGGQTAICPRCGIDAVLGDAQPLELTPELIKEMNLAWF